MPTTVPLGFTTSSKNWDIYHLASKEATHEQEILTGPRGLKVHSLFI